MNEAMNEKKSRFELSLSSVAFVWSFVLFIALSAGLLVGVKSWADEATAGAADTAAAGSLEASPTPAVTPVSGRVAYLPKNSDAWFARYQLLKSAKRSIITTYFIIEKDVFGEAFLGLLMNKAREGLEVKLMLDARGSFKLAHGLLGKDILQDLVEAGVEVRIFNPFVANRLQKAVIVSNHDKILLVDDEYLVVGGRNIADRYFLDPSDDPEVYFDADIAVDSVGVANAVRRAFDDEFDLSRSNRVRFERFGNWYTHTWFLNRAWQAITERMTNESLSADTTRVFPALEDMNSIKGGISYEIRWSPEQANVSILDNLAYYGWRKEITEELHRELDAAQSEILMMNPYVILTPQTKEKLVQAGARGVKIKIVTNSPISSDSYMTQAAFLIDWKKILKEVPGVEIFVDRGPSKLHAKVFAFDRKRAIVGSFNLDYMSDRINSEIAVEVESDRFAGEVADAIESRAVNQCQKLSIDKNHFVGPDSLTGYEKVAKKMRKNRILSRWFRKYL